MKLEIEVNVADDAADNAAPTLRVLLGSRYPSLQRRNSKRPGTNAW
jgi:hypothetical protein